MSKLANRLLVAAVLIALFGVILWFGGWVQCAVFTAGAVIAVYEIGTAFDQKDRRPFWVGAYLFAAGYFALYKLFGLEAVFLLFMAAAVITVMDRILTGIRQQEDTFSSFVALVYPLSFFLCIAMVAEYAGDYNKSRIALLSIFAMPLLGDTLAYTFGRLFGKKKLCPAISPNKTVAGGIGGVFGGGLGGVLVYFMQGVFPADVPLLLLTVLGLLCGVLGQFGDLFASTVKRWTGIKDYSRLFGEHGGVMDRLDSVLFCAPIVYAVFKIMGV